MAFIDHPLTEVFKVLESDEPIRTAKAAIKVVDALKYSTRLCGMCSGRALPAIDRLMAFLTDTTTKVHRVDCAHEELRKNGAGYLCVKCKVVVLKAGD